MPLRALPVVLRVLCFVLVALIAACGGGGPPAPAAVDVGAPGAVVAADPPGAAPRGAAVAVDEGLVPVGPQDPQWGNPVAPVTIVVFSDFQCPFCTRLGKTLSELQVRYGTERLRIAFKHNPLPFHDQAQRAAEVGAAIHQLGGDRAFWAYHDVIFSAERNNSEAMPGLMERGLGEAARVAPISATEVSAAANTRGAAKVAADLELGKRLGVTGTPASFVNGIFVSGAQPLEVFVEHVDAELRAAEQAVATGVAPNRLYATRVVANGARGVERPAPEGGAGGRVDPPAPDTTVWKVPVAGAPVRGPASALVTIVTFSDFECPFCARVQPTLTEIEKRYAGKVRLAFRHNPLPFHKGAEPAAQLAVEIFQKKGNDAFWRAHDELFASQRSLERATFERIAASVGLSAPAALAAVDGKRHARVLEADMALAEDVEARGTPTFFINGRRLSGAQPVDKFAALIDEELAKAEALVRAGTRPDRVYDALMANAKGATLPDRVKVPAPARHSPSRGPAGAPVLVTLFSDFQCPYCQRHADTLVELEKEFPGQIRIVFRNLALPMHPNAHAAATAALEARRQKGDAGFWKLHDAMFADQRGLDRAGLLQKAGAVGLDVTAMERALDTNAFVAELDADAAAAKALGFDGTPTTVVGDFVVEGAQPIAKIRRLVRITLDERKGGKR